MDRRSFLAAIAIAPLAARAQQRLYRIGVIELGGPYSGSPGTAINFTGNATDPSSADTAAGFTYSWNFGDGATSTLQNPSHSYAAVGTYTVTLTAKDKDGATGSANTSTTAELSLLTMAADVPFGAHNPNQIAA